jgi:hypothetical protein
MKPFPLFLKRYFWDVDFKRLDSQRNAEYVISRILEYGDVDALKWLFKVFDSRLIKKTLSERRGFSPKTANFWGLFFDLDKRKIRCLKKSYRKTPKTHWLY